MKIIFDGRARKLLKFLPEEDKGRISGYINLLEKNGLSMPGKYLKKIANNLWELRPGSMRVLFGLIGSDAMIVNIFRKKSQKTPQREIETARRRLKEY